MGCMAAMATMARAAEALGMKHMARAAEALGMKHPALDSAGHLRGI